MDEEHHTKGRMAKGHRRDHHDFASRDYEDIDCQATGCMFNRNQKCSVPSRCAISDTGSCTGFKVRPTPSAVDGD